MTSGIQADAWGAFVPNRGNIAPELRKGVINEVEARGLPNLDVLVGELAIGNNALEMMVGEKREYVCFSQKLGASANATLALRIAPKGAQDLELSWRLLESNTSKTAILGLSQLLLIFLGLFVIVVGLILIVAGAGACLVPVGIWMVGSGLGWWGSSRNKSHLTAHEMFDSRVLAQTVDYCLMAQLEKFGVSAEELKILQAAQMQGIGNLGPK